MPVMVSYDGLELGMGYRADMLVERCVLVELKSVEGMPKSHKKQALTNTRLAGMRLGLLINFGEALLKSGVTRLANGLPDTND